VRVGEFALSDHEGVARLHVSSNSGEASLADDLNVRSIQVATRTLDSYSLVNVGFIKVDVEGHELHVLRGSWDTIHASRPVIFVEVEHRHGSDIRAVAKLLESNCAGWTSFFLQNGRLKPLRDFDVDADQIALESATADPNYVSNFLFLPPKVTPLP